MPAFKAVGVNAVASNGTASQVVVPPADTTNPTLAGPIAITAVTTSGAHAAWPAGSDNVGVSGYEVSCDTGTASWVDVGTALSRDFSGLAPNTAYTARVRVRDTSGNYSAPITQGFTTSQVYVPPAQPDARYARPLSDVSTGQWIASDSGSLAHAVKQDDGITMSTTAPGACEIKLGPVVDPQTSSGQVVRYQVWSSTGGGLTVRLKQGATIIAQWTHAALSTIPNVYTQSLTATQCDAITDYADLRFEFEAL